LKKKRNGVGQDRIDGAKKIADGSHITIKDAKGDPSLYVERK